eukprot:scaffold24638_cov48-Cyclotella_meneghiniana.AAC.5
MESCAACGKADFNLKACSACKLVKYCGVGCQAAHRSEHKKECMTRAAELFDAKLFAEPRRKEECPICCIPMPPNEREIFYMGCCGKHICIGCRCCLTRNSCPYCNARLSLSEEEANKRLFERIEKYNDPVAMNHLGSHYLRGKRGFPVDKSKAVELYERACELGSASANNNLANLYYNGEGVQADKKKRIHYYQVAAMMGHEVASC